MIDNYLLKLIQNILFILPLAILLILFISRSLRFSFEKAIAKFQKTKTERPGYHNP